MMTALRERIKTKRRQGEDSEEEELVSTPPAQRTGCQDPMSREREIFLSLHLPRHTFTLPIHVLVPVSPHVKCSPWILCHLSK